MEQQPIKVYTKTKDDLVAEIGSSVFISDTSDWIEVDEGYGNKYAHAQNSYLDKPLTDMQGCHNYKYIAGEVMETTQAEKESEKATWPTPEPTTEELQAEQNIDFDYRLSLVELGL